MVTHEKFSLWSMRPFSPNKLKLSIDEDDLIIVKNRDIVHLTHTNHISVIQELLQHR